ncbi:putative receptor protein kinase ZmPK1 [Hordeum vulgare]|nr:putative receptor protein kinase ZmPK1 [Hordeum vulgare]
MAPQTTSTGGGAPAPTVTRALPLKLPNAPSVKKAIKKVSGKKKKAVDGSTRPPKKKLARRATDVAATKAPVSSFVPPASNAHNVFDGMPTSFNDETYMTTMGAGSNNFHWSQTNDVHLDDHEFEVDGDGEGIVHVPKGRAGNYTMDEDVLLCNTWLKVCRDSTVGGDQSRDAYWIRMKEHFDLYNKSGIDRMERSLRYRWSTINKDCQKWAAALKAVDTLNPSGTNDRDTISAISFMILPCACFFFGVSSANLLFCLQLTIAQNLFQGEEKKSKKGKIKKGRPFTLPNCYDVLKDDEKWRPCEGVDEESNKRKRTIDLDDDDGEDSSSDGGKRSPTPNSVAYSKPNRPSGGKKDRKEKKKRKGDDELKNAMKAIVNARKEANEVRKMSKNQDAATEEGRVATEERRVAAKERKVALEEKKLGMEERPRLLKGKYLFFIMDTSTLGEQQKEYVKLAREKS